MKCLICQKECKSNRSLGCHIKRAHNISREEYDKKFNLLKRCKKCNKYLLKKAKLEFCTKCRERSGKNNPMYGKTVYEQRLKKHGKEKAEELEKIRKEKTSKSIKEKWKDDDYRETVIRNSSKPRHKNFKKEQSKRIKKWFENNPEQKEIRSKSMKKSWREGKIEPNINSINESKYEKELRNILTEKLKDIACVKKKTIKIGKKWFYPDILINDKFIIEYYGNYWHANPVIFNKNDKVHHNFTANAIWERDKNRKQILENNGYKFLIVWENEFKSNKENVINEIIKEFYLYEKEKSI